MFTHLHAHTEASIADGLFGPKKWVEALKTKNFKAHAITDHGTMASCLPFYSLAKKEGIIPILGVEGYFVDNPLDHSEENRKANHIVLLAKNYDGFQNLLRLSKLSYTDGFYYRPRMGLEWLKQYGEGLICLTACQGGILSGQVWNEREDKPTLGLEERFHQFQEIFGDDFYVEFQGHKGEGQVTVNEAFYSRLRNLPGFKPVVTNDCHYVLPEHAKIQGLLKEMAYRTKSESAGQSYTECDSLWLKTPRDVLETFKEEHPYLPTAFIAEGMRATEEIVEKCANFELPTGKRYLPKFRPAVNSKQFFRELVVKKLGEFLRYGDLHAYPKDYKERFADEYATISKYNLEDYFLIVWDLCRFAREKGIYVGLGRGSAAGSLISYLLGIVQIDPLEYDLIFARFLNQVRCEQGELPDIDLDFESLRRNEIKDYIFATYGRECVCEIGTYGRMKLRTALIDFGKTMNVGTWRELMNITTVIEEDDLESAVNESIDLKNLLLRHPDFAFVVEEIQGQIKSQSVHPAGVLICSQPVAEITPVKSQKAKGEDGKSGERVVTTQSEDKQVIAQGLMKLDVLGLKEYDIIKFVIENAPGCPYTPNDFARQIMREERKEPNRKVWSMFQAGKTEGVFQFSSVGMQGLLRDMQPTSVKDLIAANALFRPGCLKNGWDKQYCRRKRGEEPVSYPHKSVQVALGETYGVIVYQEQFMRVIHELGDVSLVESDMIRSALGKKDEAKLEKYREVFVTGAEKKIGQEAAEALWEQIKQAASYTFNKSHAAAYSVLALVSQTLKVKYPSYFWAAQLNWDIIKGKDDEKLIHKRAAAEMGVKFVMPHINQSKDNFRVDQKGQVIFSLRSVKGIGEKTAKEIARHQPFRSFEDFYERVHKGVVKVHHVENLVFAGCFDEFGDRREHLKMLSEWKGKALPKLTDEYMILQFKEVMGFFEQKLKKMNPGFPDDLCDETNLRDLYSGMRCGVGGMIAEVRSLKTKRGEPMGKVRLVDLDEDIEVTVFPQTWAKYRSLLKEGSLVIVRGKKSSWKGVENAIEADSIVAIV